MVLNNNHQITRSYNMVMARDSTRTHARTHTKELPAQTKANCQTMRMHYSVIQLSSMMNEQIPNTKNKGSEVGKSGPCVRACVRACLQMYSAPMLHHIL